MMTLAAMLLAAGCVKEDESDNGGGGSGGGGDNTDVSINPEYVPIDWEKTSLVSSDDNTGNYTIQFDSAAPDIHPGSVITIDKDTAVLYRYVESVSVSGNTVNITSSEAYLTDIFVNTDFTLTTVRGSKSKAKGAVFYPSKVMKKNKNGRRKLIKPKGETIINETIKEVIIDKDGVTLKSGDNWRLYMERMNIYAGLGLELYMNFDGVWDAYRRHQSKAIQVDAALIGTFNIEQILRLDIEGSDTHTPSEELWIENVMAPVDVEFIVGGVPVWIELTSDLYRQLEFSASGRVSAYVGFTNRAEGRIGFEYHEAVGINPVSSFSNNFVFIPPTIEGQGEVRAKVWAFPRIKMMVYGGIGPSFDLKPYLSATAKGGFREQLMGEENDYIGWSLDYNAGLDCKAALEIDTWFYDESFSTDNINIIDRPLFHSPKRIVHAFGRPEIGARGHVYFYVFDQNFITDTEVQTNLPQVVKFSANGELSSQYGICRDGVVSVEWTPEDENDILYAKLYNGNGNVVSRDTVHIAFWNWAPTEGQWIDLGLPSGTLWASHNVGASVPEDYGDHFAWAETEHKNLYDWNTYTYQNMNYAYGASHVVKYHGGDTLRILEASDDAATANWGGLARTPTTEEWEELIQNTTQNRVKLNGIPGRRYVGSNGNSIFLPYGGRYGFSGDRTLLEDRDSIGYYWSSNVMHEYDNNIYQFEGAWAYYFYKQGPQGVSYDHYRFYGHSVRPVRSSNRK